MIKAFVLSFLIYIGWLTPIHPVVVVGFDPGGQVGTYMEWWDRVNESGLDVVIDGACISACTLVLGAVPTDRICMTDRASFGFHLAGDENGPNQALTDLLERTIFPKWVQEWIEAHGPMEVEPKYATWEDFKDHIRKCTSEDFVSAGVSI